MEYALAFGGIVIVKCDRLFWQVREIACPQIVAHGGPCAARVDVWRAAAGDGVIVVHGPEINAVARDLRAVRHRLVQLGARENNDTAWRREEAHSDRLKLLLRLWLLARVALDVLHGRRA